MAGLDFDGERATRTKVVALGVAILGVVALVFVYTMQDSSTSTATDTAEPSLSTTPSTDLERSTPTPNETGSASTFSGSGTSIENELEAASESTDTTNQSTDSSTETSAAGIRNSTASSNATPAYNFVPKSLTDWEFAPQNTYTASNKTRYASPNGSSTGDGTSKTAPISLARASSIVEAGDVVYLLPGTYNQAFTLADKDGTASAPIVFTTEPGSARKAIISHGESYIAQIRRSDYVTIDSLVFDGEKTSVWGIATNRNWKGDQDATGGSKNFSFIGNEIRNVGKEYALNISWVDGALIFNNYFHDVGLRSDGHGEGIYLGCGGCPWQDNNSTNVVVSNNRFWNVGGEAIEAKAGVRNVTISGNLVQQAGWKQLHSNDTRCCFGAAIVVHLISSRPNFDTNALVENNRVGTLTYGGILVGAGNSIVRNNIAWETGVPHPEGYHTVTPSPQPAYMTNNVFWGINDKVTFTNNYAFDLPSDRLFSDDNTYGQTAQQKADLVSQEIELVGSESAAFNQWVSSSY